MTTVSGGSGLFVIFDVDGRHVLTSSGVHEFTGQPSASIVGSTWLQLTHPDDLGHARDFCRKAFRERRSFAGWWRIRRHDGVFVWAMVGGTPMSSQVSDAAMAYMVAIDPLSQPDAFPRAGGIIGPELSSEADPPSRLSRLERLADVALMASALARETGEAAIADAFDAPLEQIGFRLARLTEQPPAATEGIRDHRRGLPATAAGGARGAPPHRRLSRLTKLPAWASQHLTGRGKI